MSNTPPPEIKPTDSAKEVKVRMLIDHKHNDETCACNSVQSVDAGTAKSWVKSGIADDDAAAVAYAEELAVKAEKAAKKK